MKFWKKTALSFGMAASLLFCTAPAMADSSSRLDIPDPAYFQYPDTVSMMVVRANPDDQGFKSLFDTAWSALSGAKGLGSDFLYRAILSRIQGGNSNAFSALLPAQFVRVDSLPQDATEPHPTTVTTVSGWPGLQQLWYMTQKRNSEGDKCPKVKLEDATLILRDGHEDPKNASVLTRLDGTIVSFPSEKKARYVVDRYTEKTTSSPNPEFGELLSSIDRSHDTYGVLVNRKGSVKKLLKWLHKGDYARAEAKVGKERFDGIMKTVKSMTWEGDLISDNECKFILRFRTTTPEARKELAAMLKDVREVLADYGRAGKMETSGLDNELYVNFEMVGYRDMMVGYIQRNF